MSREAGTAERYRTKSVGYRLKVRRARKGSTPRMSSRLRPLAESPIARQDVQPGMKAWLDAGIGDMTPSFLTPDYYITLKPHRSADTTMLTTRSPGAAAEGGRGFF